MLTELQCCVAGASGGGGNLPTLDATQSAHARAIIAEAKKENLGRQGCLAGIATALTEVSPNAETCRFSIYTYTADTMTVEHPYLCQRRRSRFTRLPA
jgi:uncharacterized protein YfaQ (DUF2300 family)